MVSGDEFRSLVSARLTIFQAGGDPAVGERLADLGREAVARRANPSHVRRPQKALLLVAVFSTLWALLLLALIRRFDTFPIIISGYLFVVPVILLAGRGRARRAARAAQTGLCRACRYDCNDLPRNHGLPWMLSYQLGPDRCPECGAPWPWLV